MVVGVMTVACGGTPSADKTTPATAPAAPVAVQVGQENVIVARRERLLVGPIISGQLTAVNEATVRAQQGGSMLEVTREEGQTVTRGQVLGRIEARTLIEQRLSAQSAVRLAENQLASARRESDRTAQLVTAGAIATRDLDLARTTVANAEASLADAQARLAAVDRQMGEAVIVAPLSGIVATRSVNRGDVVTAGMPLFTIVDLSSLRLEAAVPSEELGVLKVGVPVEFTVRGYSEPLSGRIERIAPQADPATRQVTIFVAIPNVGGRLVAGLFAEGRVVTASAAGLVVPMNAVNTSGSTPFVVKAAGGKVEKVDVTLGLRDARTERVEVTAGLSEGDVVLRGAAQGITPGTPVQYEAPR
jgi:RND family efflux transporter MFP subunit